MSADARLVIRSAAPGDEILVARFIRDLARFENLERELDVSEERLRRHLFGPQPACGALLAAWGPA